MQKLLSTLLCVLWMSFSFNAIGADEAVVDEYAYFGFEPDIITNYIGDGKKIGFVRITMEIMVKSADHIEIIEHHSPLIRATVVEILGEQTETKIKSASGKFEIRELCLNAINRLLKKETGKELAERLLFTKYIYH